MLLLLLVLGGAGFAVYWFYFQKKDEKTQYQTVPVKKGDVIQAVTASGTLHAVISVEVGSQISGIIKTLHADFNTNVKSGQVIAQLDPATYEAIAHQNEGELDNAKANLELAMLNEKRKRELVSEADIGGVKVGQTATFIVDAFPGRTFEGKVQMVRYAPITVENVVTYVTIIEVANPKLELRPGMTANVSIVLAKREDTIAVSNAALRFKPAPAAGAEGKSRGGEGESRGRGSRSKDREEAPETTIAKRKVYVLENGEPKPLEIETGITDGVLTEVISGLSEGQEVITSAFTPSPTASAPAMGSPFGGAPPRR